MSKTFEQVEGEKIAKRVLAGADLSLGWREAGYGSAAECAAVLVGDGYDRDQRDVAVAIVADALTEG